MPDNMRDNVCLINEYVMGDTRVAVWYKNLNAKCNEQNKSNATHVLIKLYQLLKRSVIL